MSVYTLTHSRRARKLSDMPNWQPVTTETKLSSRMKTEVFMKSFE